MKYLKITKGFKTIIDDDDFKEVSRYRWYYKNTDRHGYAVTDLRTKDNSYGTRHVSLHRFLLKPPRDRVVDHINGKGLDNRRCNLRICTLTENNGNFFIGIRNKSGYKGVSWHKSTQKWRATLLFKGKQQYLGIYTDKLEAAKAYNKAALKFFGDFARINTL